MSPIRREAPRAPLPKRYRITFVSEGRLRFFTSAAVVSTSAAKREAEKYIAKWYGPEAYIVRISDRHVSTPTSGNDGVFEEERNPSAS